VEKNSNDVRKKLGQRHFGGTMIGNVTLIHHVKNLECSSA
jgi:hypothetical protein